MKYNPTESLELVLCPYCFSNKVSFSFDDSSEHPVCFIICNECGARGPEAITRRIAISLWNEVGEFEDER